MAGMLSCAFSYRSENSDMAQNRFVSKSVNVSVSITANENSDTAPLFLNNRSVLHDNTALLLFTFKITSYSSTMYVTLLVIIVTLRTNSVIVTWSVIIHAIFPFTLNNHCNCHKSPVTFQNSH